MEPIPAYIHISEADLSTDYPTQGTNSEKITDVWMFVNDQQIGVFELPVSVPILTTGETKISLQAGIFGNGQSHNRLRYPFYAFWNREIDLQSEEIDTIRPTFQYDNSLTEFVLLNDFESSDNFENKQSEPEFAQAFINTNAEEVFEGNRSACVVMTPDQPYFQYGSISPYKIPGGDDQTFVEVNYNIEQPCLVYVQSIGGLSNSLFEVILNLLPTDGWNKIYIDLSRYFPVSEETDGIQFGFLGELSDSLINANQSAQFCFDNIKLLRSK